MPDPAHEPEAAFPSTPFRWFWAGETVSAFGSYVTLLALQSLVVLTLDGTAQDVGWLNSCRWLPYVVLGLVVGAWVDQRARRPVMVATDLARAALLGIIPLAWGFDVLSLPLVLTVVLAFGVASLVNDAASQSFVPRLVPRGHLQRAHARLDSGDAVAQSGGPALAGALVSLVGAPLAVLVDAVSFLFSATVVLRLPVAESAPVAAPRSSSLWRRVREGVSWVYGGTGLTRLAIATHVWFVGQAVVGVVVVPYAFLVLHLSALQVGITTALAGIGAVLGTLVTGAVGRRLGTGGAVIAAHLGSAIAVLVMAASGLLGDDGSWFTVAVLGAGQFLHGTSMGVSNSHEMAFRQLLTPDDLQARTNTTMRSLNRGVVVLVAPVAGFVAATGREGQVLASTAAFFALAAAILLLSPFRRDRSTV